MFSMISVRGQLIICTLLLIMAGCSRPRLKRTEYSVQTTCSGGGGFRACVARNAADDKLDPFDLEVEFLDDRGFSIGRSLIRNSEGLKPKSEWRFDLTGPASTRSIRFGRVIPMN